MGDYARLFCVTRLSSYAVLMMLATWSCMRYRVRRLVVWIGRIIAVEVEGRQINRCVYQTAKIRPYSWSNDVSSGD